MRNARMVLGRLFAAAATACASSATATTATPPSASAPASTPDARNPIGPQHGFIYGSRATTQAPVQNASTKLVAGLRLPNGVDAKAIASTTGTAAVEIVERDPPGNFGDLLPAAQRALFDRFASDPHLAGGSS